MNTAVLTGGTGFLGFWLLKELVKNNVFVYVVVRKDSRRLDRLSGISGIEVIELDMDNISALPQFVKTADVFYHLAWEGERNDFNGQMQNIKWAVNAMQIAKKMGIKQFVMTGSQAEYGINRKQVDENSKVNPNTAYGASKLACYYLLKTLSEQIDLTLTWVRVFSVYGEGDNSNTLMSYLIKCFRENETVQLTKCTQMWDFLYAEDAAVALYLLGKRGKAGLFNLAFGESRSLREFVIEARNLLNPNSKLDFGVIHMDNFVNLYAKIDKIQRDIGWKPTVEFKEGILKMRGPWNGTHI